MDISTTGPAVRALGAVSLLLTSTPVWADATIYHDPQLFDAAILGGQVQVEGFEGSLVDPFAVEGCDEPLDSSTDNACFSPGGLLPGLTFSTVEGLHDCATGSCPLVVFGPQAIGNESVELGPNFADDTLRIEFGPEKPFMLALDLAVNDTTELFVIDLQGQVVAVHEESEPAFFGIEMAPGKKIQAVEIILKNPNPLSAAFSIDDVIVVTEQLGVADLLVEKSDDVDPVRAGKRVTYTITVTNLGPDDAQNVVATENLPPGLALVGTSGCPDDPAGIPTCSLGFIPAGGSKSYTVTVETPDSFEGSFINEVTVLSDTPDDDSTNNRALEQTQVYLPQADLSITKTDDRPLGVPFNGLVTYTITVRNAGPDAAENVHIVDLLPPGLVFVSSQGCGTGGSSCIVDHIPVGGRVEFKVTARATQEGHRINVARVFTLSDGSRDPDSSNDQATCDTYVHGPVADLEVKKVADMGTALVGDTITYAITVTNRGPDAAPNVVATDILGPGLTLVSTSGCPEDPIGAPTCRLGTIQPGAGVSFRVRAGAVRQGLRENRVVVGSDGSTDPDTANNADSAHTLVRFPQADLAITKTDDMDPVSPGGLVVYTITVANRGSIAAQNVVVTESLPTGMTVVSSSGCQGGSGVPYCHMGSIAAGGKKQFRVTVRATKEGTFTNVVSVESDTADFNLDNNRASEETDVSDFFSDYLVEAVSLILDYSVDPIFGNVILDLEGVPECRSDLEANLIRTWDEKKLPAIDLPEKTPTSFHQRFVDRMKVPKYRLQLRCSSWEPNQCWDAELELAELPKPELLKTEIQLHPCRRD